MGRDIRFLAKLTSLRLIYFCAVLLFVLIDVLFIGCWIGIVFISHKIVEQLHLSDFYAWIFRVAELALDAAAFATVGMFVYFDLMITFRFLSRHYEHATKELREQESSHRSDSDGRIQVIDPEPSLVIASGETPEKCHDS